MRDEKEGRKKQARSYKLQGKATQHTQGSHLYNYDCNISMRFFEIILLSCRPVKPVSSSSLAVKEYVRAGAGHHVPTPDELRPPNILVETMEYLITW